MEKRSYRLYIFYKHKRHYYPQETHRKLQDLRLIKDFAGTVCGHSKGSGSLHLSDCPPAHHHHPDLRLLPPLDPADKVVPVSELSCKQRKLRAAKQICWESWHALVLRDQSYLSSSERPSMKSSPPVLLVQVREDSLKKTLAPQGQGGGFINTSWSIVYLSSGVNEHV